MAEPTFLALLDNQSRVGAEIGARLDRTLSQAAENKIKERQLQQRAGEFEQEMAFRETAHVAEMSYKNADLAERTRQASMQAAHWQFTDEIASRKFEEELNLIPLKLEASKLQLESAKINQQRQLQDVKYRTFNSITAPFDAAAASELAGNRNEEFGNNYLALKAKHQASVASGNPFDAATFQGEYDTLKSQYAVTETPKGYNPSVATMLDKFGATAEANRMRAESPVFAGNIMGLKAQAFLGGPQAAGQFMATHGTYAFGTDNEAAANFAVASQAYFGLDMEAKRIQEDKKALTYQFNSIDADDPSAQIEKTRIANREAELNKQLISNQLQRETIYKNALGIKMGEEAKTVEEETPASRFREMNEQAKKEQKEAMKNAPAPPMGLEKDVENKAAQANIGNYSIEFKKALGGVSFKSWEDKGRDIKENPAAYVTSLRNVIIKNLNEMPFSAKEMDKDDTTNLTDLIQSPQFEKIFDRFKNSAIPAGDGGLFIGNRLPAALEWTTGSQYDEIETFEELKERISNFEGSEEEKRMFAERIYATVVAAGAVAQMQKGL